VSNVELDAHSAALNKFERVFYAIVSNVETPSYSDENAPTDVAPFGKVLRESLAYLATGERSLGTEVPYDQFSKANETLMANHGIDIDFKKIVHRYWQTFLPESGEL